MHESQITVQGNLATDVRHLVTDTGVHLAKFRVASTRRRFVRATGEWVDAGTSFYAVTAWRFLAQNAAASLRKGDPVFIIGSLRVRDWSTDDGKSGTTADIEADTLGHDLSRGTAVFQRVTRTREVDRVDDSGEDARVSVDRAVTPLGVDALAAELLEDAAVA